MGKWCRRDLSYSTTNLKQLLKVCEKKKPSAADAELDEIERLRGKAEPADNSCSRNRHFELW